MAIEIYPVVHVRDVGQGLEQSGVAFDSGADGVYLIDHHNSDNDTLIQSFNAVSLEYPDGYVGLNFLPHSSGAQSLLLLLNLQMNNELTRMPDGLWSDDADQEMENFVYLRAENTELQNIRYLGGVAFKYSPLFTNDPVRAAAEALRLAPFVDVITTSGAGTGKPPNPQKIEAMKNAVPDKPLAVASGITHENLVDYSGNFDQLLVSTSVETAPYSGIFDPKKLKNLIDLAHKL